MSELSNASIWRQCACAIIEAIAIQVERAGNDGLDENGANKVRGLIDKWALRTSVIHYDGTIISGESFDPRKEAPKP